MKYSSAWINVLLNNSFVNPMQLPSLCEQTRALAIGEPGLIAGWQVRSLLGR